MLIYSGSMIIISIELVVELLIQIRLGSSRGGDT